MSKLSKYDIVHVLSIRAEQIRRGTEPCIEHSATGFDPLRLAVDELEQGKLPFVLTQGGGGKQRLCGRVFSDMERRMVEKLVDSMRHRHCYDGPRLLGPEGKHTKQQ